MSGLIVQLGPRGIGRHCAGLGRLIARNALFVRMFAGTLAVEGVLAFVMVMLAQSAASTPPTAFCPAGKHVIAIDATTGWPVCANNLREGRHP